MSIFEHTDKDSDRILITEVPDDDSAGDWLLAAMSKGVGTRQVYLDTGAISRLYNAASAHLFGTPELPPRRDPDQGSYPEDGRRVAALNAAAGALPNARSGMILDAARWILGEPTTD